jgi:hypothetical protein
MLTNNDSLTAALETLRYVAHIRALDLPANDPMWSIAEPMIQQAIKAIEAERERWQKDAAVIGVEAVAEVVADESGFPTLNWLIEGGVAALPPGVQLVVPHRPITSDDGFGEVTRVALPVKEK